MFELFCRYMSCSFIGYHVITFIIVTVSNTEPALWRATGVSTVFGLVGFMFHIGFLN